MSLRDDVAEAFRECIRLRGRNEALRAVTGTPSSGHDEVDEVLGLLRVTRQQRDDAEKQVAALRGRVGALEELLITMAWSGAAAGGQRTCPMCGAQKCRGHHSGCPLTALLPGIEGKEKP